MPRGRRHRRLRLSDALWAHAQALKFGGRPGILNFTLVESALARPYNGYYRPIAAKAAALVESFAKNHGFVDGNKRTTVILLDVLLTDSGYRLTASNSEVEEMVLGVVEDQLNFTDLQRWLKERIIGLT